MFAFIVNSICLQCVQLNFTDYPQNLSEIQSGAAIQLTNNGINTYLNKNIIFSGDYLMQAQIPDIELNIKPFKFRMSDIKIADYVLPVSEIHYKTNSADFTMKNMSLHLKAQFNILQTTYPYFQDQGMASLQVIGISITSVGQLYFTQQCPLHYLLNITNPTLGVDNIQITLDGKLASIYNSILSVLTKTLENQFNQIIGSPLINAIMQVANDGLASSNNFVMNGKTNDVGFNQQPVKTEIDSDFLSVYVVGQSMLTENDPNVDPTAPISGYKNYTYPQFPRFVTNDHVQYKFHYLNFQSNFDAIMQRQIINPSKGDMKITKITVKEFANTGMDAEVTVQTDNATYLVEVGMMIQADPLYYAYDNSNHTLVYIEKLKPIQVFQNDKPVNLDEKLQKQLQDTLQIIPNVTRDQAYGIQITNSNGINKCNTITIDKEWLHIGCVILT